MNHNEFANASTPTASPVPPSDSNRVLLVDDVAPLAAQPTASGSINQRLNGVVETLREVVQTANQITLEVPIQRGEQSITAITLRKPDAGSLRGIKLMDLLQMDVGALSTLLPRITSPALTPADVGKLDPVDLISLGTEVSTFFVPRKDRASQPA